MAGYVKVYVPLAAIHAMGIADPSIAFDDDLTEVVNLNRHLHDDFMTLVDDAIEYIECVLTS